MQFDLEQLRVSATTFETRVYPTTRRLYGEEWTPGIDSDPHINILVARIPGAAAGYFNSSDELPLWVNEFSSEREMVYINSLAARPGTSYFSSVVAHELCHMIQYGKRKRSQVWFNEGQAQLCELANGFPVSHAQTFLQLPDTQLNDWPELEQSQAHYGLAYLFLEFARQQAGGDDLINAFMARGIDTPADLDAVLRARGQRGIEELFLDFVAANAFIGSSAEARYSYPGGLAARTPAGPTDQDRVTLGNTLCATTHEYAARYVELPRAVMKIRFEGARETKLLPTDPHSGKAMWWSDRADGLDSTLTRTVDLRGATAPKLSFWTWFEIEKDYDYAYVAVSTDGGARWTTLAAPATTRDDPNGSNLGNGYTDNSGGGRTPAWIQQEVDLSPYAGKEIQLRFEYVTDGALNLHGMAIDDIAITGLSERRRGERQRLEGRGLRALDERRRAAVRRAAPALHRQRNLGRAAQRRCGNAGPRRGHLRRPAPAAARRDRLRGPDDAARAVQRDGRAPMTRDARTTAPGVKPVRYGVIPAGGLGTRFLPISRAVPKELIPIVDTPVIEIVVTEMTESGIERVVLVVGPGKGMDRGVLPAESADRGATRRRHARKRISRCSSAPSASRR